MTKKTKENTKFVKERINPILRPLIRDLLISKPKSVVRFILNRSHYSQQNG